MLMRRHNASFIKQNYRHALETSVLELKKKGMLLNGQFVIMCSDSTVARKCKVRETQLPKTTVEDSKFPISNKSRQRLSTRLLCLRLYYEKKKVFDNAHHNRHKAVTTLFKPLFNTCARKKHYQRISSDYGART